MKPKIIVFPKDPNPYQRLLYRELEGDFDVTYFTLGQHSLTSFVSFMPQIMAGLVRYRLSGYRLIHIHWIYPFYVPAKVPFHRWLTGVEVKIFYWLLTVLRYKVVWTVHNVVPQMSQSLDDADLMKRLSQLAAAKIVHATTVIDEMKRVGLETDKTTVIPHGSYIDVYPKTVTVEAARKKLGLATTDRAVLFFGNIAAYKGVENLIEAVGQINDPKLKVLVVGSCNDEELKHKLQKMAKGLPVAFYFGRVPDNEVSAYFEAADYVCLPFTAITTSGSTILALSFGKPVIVPRMGALNDLPDGVGYFYDPNESRGLVRAIARAVSDKDSAEKGNRALTYAKSIGWDTIARQTKRVYEEVLEVRAKRTN